MAALVIIIGIFGLLRPASFFTLKNFLNITRQSAPLAMVALGATFVMTINEFDLSIGNIVSLGGVVAALEGAVGEGERGNSAAYVSLGLSETNTADPVRSRRRLADRLIHHASSQRIERPLNQILKCLALHGF